MGNMQGGQGGSDGPQSFNHPSSFGHGNPPPPQGGASQQPGDNSGFIGWGGGDGSGHQGPPNPGPPTQPPTWSRDQNKGFMKYNM